MRNTTRAPENTSKAPREREREMSSQTRSLTHFKWSDAARFDGGDDGTDKRGRRSCRFGRERGGGVSRERGLCLGLWLAPALCGSRPTGAAGGQHAFVRGNGAEFGATWFARGDVQPPTAQQKFAKTFSPHRTQSKQSDKGSDRESSKDGAKVSVFFQRLVSTTLKNTHPTEMQIVA